MKALIIIIVSLLFTGCANLFYEGTFCVTDSNGNIIQTYSDVNTFNRGTNDIILKSPSFVYFSKK